MSEGKMRGILGAIIMVCVGGAAHAQPFDAGSDGTLGAVVVSANTAIVLPPDGILHYASLTIEPGITVSFVRNAANTPVYILATGDIRLGDGATIDVSGENGAGSGLGGRGGPGGFAGGNHVDETGLASAGMGPGAGVVNPGGYGGNAGYGKVGGGGGLSGKAYGTQLMLPLIGGSGGAGGAGWGGGGGGGGVLLASNALIHVGIGATINARGGNSTAGYGAGSGGGIRLVAPIVTGSGTLDVHAGGGGHGRTRVDTLDTTGLGLTTRSGIAAVGSLMLAFLDVMPQLDVVGLGQASIPLDHEGEFLVMLPTGASMTQTITVQLTDFAGTIPLTIALTPDAGPAVLYDVEVDTASAVDGVIRFDVDVDFVANMPTVVSVWTRPST